MNVPTPVFPFSSYKYPSTPITLGPPVSDLDARLYRIWYLNLFTGASAKAGQL